MAYKKFKQNENCTLVININSIINFFYKKQIDMYKVGDILVGTIRSNKDIEREIVEVCNEGNTISYWWCYPDIIDKKFWSGWGSDIELNIMWKLKV